MSNTSESNKEIVTEFFAALNRGDVAFIVDAYAEDGCVQTMGNHADIRSFFARADCRFGWWNF